MCPVGNGSPLGTVAGQGVVVAVGRRAVAVVDDPVHEGALGARRSSRPRLQAATAQRDGDLVDPLALPLPVAGPQALGQLLVVAAGLPEAALDAVPQRLDELGGQLGGQVADLGLGSPTARRASDSRSAPAAAAAARLGQGGVAVARDVVLVGAGSTSADRRRALLAPRRRRAARSARRTAPA